MTTININLRLLTQSLIFLMLFGTILRGYAGTFYGILEFSFLLFVLTLSILYFSDKNKKFDFDYSSYLYISLLVYLIAHLIVATITRYVEYDVGLYSFILAGLYEFKIASFAYFFPFIYFMISSSNQRKFESFIGFLLKLTIVYTIIEQVLSLLGFREIFLSYMQGVIYEIHNAYQTRLGMYRPFGLIGSPHILGIVHIIGLIYMLHQKQMMWAFLSLIAIIFSTSITAYAVLVGLFGLYLIYTRKYVVIMASLLLAVFLGIIMYQRLDYILGIAHLAEYADAHPFDLFVYQIYGYYLLITNVIDPVTYVHIESGPLSKLTNYFSENPGLMIFGKGMMYTFEERHYDLVQIHNYQVFTDKFTQESSDFYILNFFEQFGLVGIVFLIINFFIVPYKKMNNSNMHHVFVLNAFVISTLHYSPAESIILMMFVSYSVYSLYFVPKEDDENG